MWLFIFIFCLLTCFLLFIFNFFRLLFNFIWFFIRFLFIRFLHCRLFTSIHFQGKRLRIRVILRIRFIKLRLPTLLAWNAVFSLLKFAHELMWRKGKRRFKLFVSLFLDLLGMLEFFDELGLEFFHLQDFLFFSGSDVFFFLNSILVHWSKVIHLLLVIFLDS